MLAAEPPHRASHEVRLAFQHDSAGRRLDGSQYPRLQVSVAGETMQMSLDTAATIALRPAVAAALRDHQPAVRAASFVKHATAARWHRLHPGWRHIANAAQYAGAELILVPEVHAGSVRFRDVWFSTRPDDDVFEGDTVAGKLGPTAFGAQRLVIDYVHEKAIFGLPAVTALRFPAFSRALLTTTANTGPARSRRRLATR